MRFGILGPVWIAEGESAAIGGPRLRGLLAMLLLEAGTVVSAERLVDGLYGEAPPRNAGNALQSLVSRLRQAMPPRPDGGSPVEFHTAGYRLAVDPEDVDVHRFARLADDGRRALRAGTPERAAALLREALHLWRGPALAELTGLPFARPQAERLEERRLAATEDHAEAALQLGRPEEAATRMRETVAANPLRERCRGLLMRALADSGRRAEALLEYDTARRLFAEELGADPSPELAEIHLELLRADEAAAAGPHGPTRIGLPSPIASFVGRAEELRRAEHLLETRRLTTFTGPGGTGKTRLAVELAWRRDGDVCFVDLSELPSGSEIAPTALGALALREGGMFGGGGGDAAGRLAAALADRSLLLILDNCEHVVAEAARLADRLLASCPGLLILATSREPLGLTGEALLRLTGLALAPEGAAPGDIAPQDAVRLFLARAADADPGFSLGPDTAEPVARICRALDGLPLGIELAAARLRSLTAADLATRLDDRFRVLTRGSRTARPRHQTLRAVVEWSWELLGDHERALARRLTVFSGATVDAVSQVTGLSEADATETLTDLVDKSLVESDSGRYRMLETVRAYAAERLDEAGEAKAMRRAHIRYFHELADEADPHLRRPEQLEWLAVLDADRDNLHTAMRTATEDGDYAAALRLGAALSFYWWLRGIRSEAAALCRAALRIAPDTVSDDLFDEHALCVLTAAIDGSDDPWLRSQQEAINRDYRTNLQVSLRRTFRMFLSAVSAGPPVDDVAALRRAHDRIAELHDDWWNVGMVNIGYGSMGVMHGDGQSAEGYFREALAGFVAVGDRWGRMLAVSGLGEALQLTGEYTAALAAVDEGLGLAEELGSVVDEAELLRVRGAIGLDRGELDAAREDYARSLATARGAGAQEACAAARAGLGDAALRSGDRAEARRLAEQALAECPRGWFSAESTRSGILELLRILDETEADGSDAGSTAPA